MEDKDEINGAIALAKAVRQTALANAKVALEEAFTEKYQAMFAQKLKEDAAEGAAPAAAPTMQAEETVSEQEIDELIKELESEVGGDDADDMAAAGAPPADASAAGAPPMDPMAGAAPAAPAAAGAQMVMCPVGTVATADMAPAPVGAVPPMGAPGVPSVAPVPPLGEPVPPVAPAPVGGEVPPAPATPPSDVPAPEGDGADEEVNLDELLESLKAEVEGEEDDETIDEQTKLASSGIAGSDNKKPSSGASASSKVESGGDKDGYAKIDQAKVVAKEATQAGRPNKAAHATKDNLSTPGMGAGNGSGGQSETGHPKTDQAKTTAKEATQASRPNQAKNATSTNLSTPGGMLQENASLKKQLAEAVETITYVKGQLNEINLLNAKLLYTNKLFKEFNMNNEQKMRVVEMFDLSKNVREVKLTFANIAESLNFSGTDIKRKAKASATAQSITEGLASQSVGSTKPSQQIISEGKANQMVTRFQQIAGIKPTKK